MKQAFTAVIFVFCSGSLLFAQDVTKIVQLDSVMITAVKGGFSVEDFIYLVKQDTSFYKAFKNLRYYPYTFESNLVVFNRRSDKEKASLYRKASQRVVAGKRWIEITEEKTAGNIYNKDKKFTYYTAELFDYTFYPRDTVVASNIITGRPGSALQDASKNQKYKDRLEVLMFNPGSEVDGIPLISSRMAIFDKDMLGYYDYKIYSEKYRDTIPCYVFECKPKTDLGYFRKDDVVIKDLVSFFERKTFSIVYRKYLLSYNSVLFDFDVKIEVRLQELGGVLVPEYITYTGYWDVPFKKPEVISFKMHFYDYKITP